MCGITGIVDFSTEAIPPEALGRLVASLRHRGPDDQGMNFFPGRAGVSPAIALGHTRLSILDLSARGHQPMPLPGTELWITYNGEIYNYPELRRDLEKRGAVFHTGTDTEAILHLYREKGPRCVDDLDGMFAFVIYDPANRRMFAARDRFGKKPLLYHWDGKRFLFASELHALAGAGGIPLAPNREALYQFLVLRYITAPLTAFEGIRRLEPAHTLTLTFDGDLRVERYWTPDYMTRIEIGEEDACRRVMELLDNAVRKRLLSDVPLGVFLSGGVDSSAIVATMARHTPDRIRTFSVGYKEEQYNELRYAESIAAHFHTRHHSYVMDPSAIDMLDDVMLHFGEPFGDTSALATYFLAQQAREHVTVTLNGDGSDEIFCGYPRHQWQGYRESNALWRLAWRCAQWLPESPDFFSHWGRLRRYLEFRNFDAFGFLIRSFSQFNEQMNRTILCDEFRRGLDLDGVSRRLEPVYRSGRNALHGQIAVDFASWLPDDLLTKIDLTTMAHGMEARCPFLDRELVEFVVSLPAELKVRNGANKVVLKQALRRVLPAEALDRRKMGFIIPTDVWIRDPLYDKFERELLSESFQARRIIRPEFIRRILAEHRGGGKNWKYELWSLYVLALWFKRYFPA